MGEMGTYTCCVARRGLGAKAEIVLELDAVGGAIDRVEQRQQLLGLPRAQQLELRALACAADACLMPWERPAESHASAEAARAERAQRDGRRGGTTAGAPVDASIGAWSARADTRGGRRETCIGHGGTCIGHGGTCIGRGGTCIGHGGTCIGRGGTVIGRGRTCIGRGRTCIGRRINSVLVTAFCEHLPRESAAHLGVGRRLDA